MEQGFDSCQVPEHKGIDTVRTDLELFPEEILFNRQQMINYIARAELCLLYTFEVEVTNGIKTLKKMIKKPLKTAKKAKKFLKREAKTGLNNKKH